MRHRKHKLGWGILCFLLVFALSGLVVMLLWNALIPDLFGIVTLNYWQALGILVLSKLLLGGFGFHKFHGHHGGGFHKHHHHHHGKEEFQDFHERFHNMSREERKKFILSRFSDHGCFDKKEPVINDEPEKE